jgi:hypothetical protein
VTNEFGSALFIESSSFEADSERKRFGGTIAGTTGQGAQIVLHTDRGMITVRKDTGAALPAPAESQTPTQPPHPPRVPKEPVQSI